MWQIATLALLTGCLPEHSVQGRSFEVWTPAAYDPSTPLPLIILAHGYGTTGQLQDQFFPVSNQLKDRKFLYVLPNGTVDRSGKRFWNATEACCDLEGRAIDDVGYFRALVDEVRARYRVQEGHIFVIGHSNGAFMALRLACEASDVFSGVVAVAGSTFLDPLRCGAGQRVPILLNHGDRDSSIPIEGVPERYPSALETGARFARRNGCTGGWRDGKRLDLLGDGATETRQSAIDGCPPSGAVELWVHERTGHLPLYDRRWTSRVVDWLEAHAR
jgi:polyhydroxybutyrate depolymerase